MLPEFWGVAAVGAEPVVPPVLVAACEVVPPLGGVELVSPPEPAPWAEISAPTSTLRCVTTPLKGAVTRSYDWRAMTRPRLARKASTLRSAAETLATWALKLVAC